ncbi:MAG: response regulator transcription factor, partial [Gammaproteobacteria bacterium]|nr:response regulator transcription factor [Gammaproteobacteria bacterium]
MQILLVEDDMALANALSESLRYEGFTVNHLMKGQLAINAIKAELPDIVILDLGLPDMDGTQVLTAIRQQSADVPVLILTARASIEDKITGLDLGADDYLAKPFDVDELLARLRVFERRASTLKHAALTIGDVTLDTVSHQVTSNGSVIALSCR